MDRFRIMKGSTLAEYAVVLGILAMVVVGSLYLVGKNFMNITATFANALPSAGDTTDMVSQTLKTADLLIKMMQDYYQEHGRWPRSWEPYNYTDLGLDPEIWKNPRNGVKFIPAGDRLGMRNVPGDDYEVYFQTPGGGELQLYDGDSIWYDFSDGRWYYNDAGGNVEVDVSTMRIEKKGKGGGGGSGG